MARSEILPYLRIAIRGRQGARWAYYRARRVIEESLHRAPTAISDIDGLVRYLRRHGRNVVLERRSEMALFAQDLEAMWGEALLKYEQAFILAQELGGSVTAQNGGSGLPSDVLNRLHARGCVTASEILALLRTGHASGAHSRWRTLHEILVTARFLFKHGRVSPPGMKGTSSTGITGHHEPTGGALGGPARAPRSRCRSRERCSAGAEPGLVSAGSVRGVG